jgi:hypothetical protein
MILVTAYEVIKQINTSRMKLSVTGVECLKTNFMFNEVNDLIPILRMAGKRAYPHFIKKMMKKISHNDNVKNMYQIILVITIFFIPFSQL